MILRPKRIAFAALFLAIVAAPSAEAAGVPAGTTDLTGTAIMDLTLLPGPFNPTGSPIVLPHLSGYGTITIDRAAEDTTTNTIAINSLSGGMFYGSYIFPGLSLLNFVFGNIAPLTGADYSGQITNVVESGGVLQSGDFSFTGPGFGFEFLSGPVAGLKLFTDPAQPFSFSSTFDGLPPSQGTVLNNSGQNVLDVSIYGDPNKTPVATTENRFIVLTTVPEPSSVVMLGLGALGLIGVVRRARAGR